MLVLSRLAENKGTKNQLPIRPAVFVPPKALRVYFVYYLLGYCQMQNKSPCMATKLNLGIHSDFFKVYYCTTEA
jgi:hypothetical protein